MRIFSFCALAGLVFTTACGANFPNPFQNPNTNVLLQDNFSTQDNHWFVAEDETGTLDYENGAYVFKLNTPNAFVWGNPGANLFSNLHITTTVTTAAAEDAAFGVICNYQDQDNFYYLGLNAKGYYAIIKFVEAKDNFLTGENAWASSPLITPTATIYQLGADCGADGNLALYVDGQTVATAQDTDSVLEPGNVGVFVWTFDTVPVEVRFDDFNVTRLPELEK